MLWPLYLQDPRALVDVVVKKIPATTRNQTLAIQPVASHITD
jgi:hypothetical protein